MPGPAEDLLDQQVGTMSSLFGVGANRAQMPKGLTTAAQMQAWNIGQLSNQLVAKYGNHNPTVQQIVDQANKMFPGFAQLPPDQQQIAQQMANVDLMTTNYGAASGVDVTKPQGDPNNPYASPTLDADIRQNFGYEAWMLDIPELRAIVEGKVQNGWGADVVQGKLEATQWWRTTSDAQRAYIELQANSPAELDFNNAGSQAAQKLALIQNQASGLGLTNMDPARMQALALQAIQFNMSTQQIAAALAAEVHYSTGAPPGPGNTAAAPIAQLKAAAAQYFQNPSDAALTQYAQQVIGGQQTLDGINSIFANQAKSQYSWLAPQIDSGQTMVQITDPVKQNLANLLEVDPATIDFQNNPKYQKVLDYVPQGDTVHRMMTTSEADTYARSDPTLGYQNTKGARDLVGQTVQNLLNTWGVVK